MIKHSCLIAATVLLHAAAAAAPAQLADFPRIRSSVAPDAKLEAQVAKIVRSMTLAQKVGQITQPEIKTITPDQVREFYIGSVLNGGGSWPNGNKYATPADWVALADKFHAASMATDMVHKIPVIWGIDAMHGNSNVYGATLFPHNIGLGAARNKDLIGKMAQSVGESVRATGIAWVFAPTLAVVRDDRWGRTYESFSEDPALVKEYGGVYVRGLQGRFNKPGNVVATAKHFIGDGGTDQGKDQGIATSSKAEMINIHGAGYYSALDAGAQTVMASFSSWNDVAGGVDYGKMHGSKALLTDLLKTKMGFDGFVVSDWNGIAQVPGCTNDSCAQAINAGIDMVMVPDDWKAFIANTIKQVEAGQIPMARLDDAVSRIVRVKLRAGLFGKAPGSNRYAGKAQALQARALARQAVRESLVLLKNDTNALPLARGKKILVVGKSADNLSNQSGGWSLTWQGTDNKNSDFPNADSILTGIREAAGDGNVTYSRDGRDVDVANFDAVVAVIGETPYAEGDGDIGPWGSLRHSARHPEDLAVLEAVAGKGKPVITVLVAGRPLYTNDLMNLSDSFVAAWLPGTEGKGVADVLFAGRHKFKGKLSFSWPRSVCQATVNVGDKDYAPLFPYGYGLGYGSTIKVGQLDAAYPEGGCGVTNVYPVFGQADRATWPLYVSSGGQRVALGADVNAVTTLPGVTVETAQVNTQQDGKLVTWTGPAQLEARAARAMALPAFATTDGALQFDTIIASAPAGAVTVLMGGVPVDVTGAFKALPLKQKQTVRVPLSCFTARGLDTSKIDTAFAVASDAPFAASFANIQVVGGAAREKDALSCGAAK
ncbi:glycoside hydrolase family 3 C-terminal domain-containing protein [Massilia sp. PAMC28688]|uniref:glycoside hydrolase family 3 N-terminal domain-containing protein n=1 Tax=Massilia sp. PAMC28688 TaxID=2861283 RepID=UPI001C627273|nr:glycoside hydrolase family 3 N-terminal domain-containing protein [Massilia sp. PAMC28688]QYF94706.1 glycoside hydrolase family 3 C-terminal domain-containing protein [Massilia sp. PAMC28688]